MRVRVLFFALYRDLAGTPDLEIDVPAGATARDAVRALRERDDSYGRLPEAPAIAVNEEYANLDAVLTDGDELALIPPVAGG
jgi:molybdopterin synthase catalytic subunit